MSLLVDAAVAALLLFSGLVVLLAALGLLRLPDFFMRMHAPALAYTLASWSVTLASVIHFSSQRGALSPSSWVLVMLLAVTAPITTVLLARAAVFRRRRAGEEVPPALGTDGP